MCCFEQQQKNKKYIYKLIYLYSENEEQRKNYINEFLQILLRIRVQRFHLATVFLLV